MTRQQTARAQEPVTFNFTSQAVRVIIIDDAPWFVAADVLQILSLDRKALERLDDDEKGVSSIHTPGGQQEMTIVNESGLYSLVLGSRKPEAKRFKKWVTAEVLPAIRKTGSYTLPATQPERQATAPEPLSGPAMHALARLVWMACNGFFGDSRWSQAIWARLRKAVACPAPRRFEEAHRPALAAEMLRILAITYSFKQAQAKAEALVLKRALRAGEEETAILAEAQKLMLEGAVQDETEALGKLATWCGRETADFLAGRFSPYQGAEFDAYRERPPLAG